MFAELSGALDRARQGDGPTLIEFKTYRFRGHSRTDTGPYRPAGELEEWLKRDPIDILKDRMISAGQLDVTEFAEMKQAAETLVFDAIAQSDKKFCITQLLHGCEVAVVGGLVANAGHVVVVITFTLPAMTVVAQALINALAIEDRLAQGYALRVRASRKRDLGQARFGYGPGRPLGQGWLRRRGEPRGDQRQWQNNPA